MNSDKNKQGRSGESWTPQWIEQAGKGAAVIWTRFTFGLERAPAESPYKTLRGPIESQRGRARGQSCQAS